MNKISNCLCVIFTFVLTISGICYAGYFLDPIYSQDGLTAVEAFHSLEEDSLDVIVFGSSRAWKGFDTGVLNDKYGISAYNYGNNWQALNTTLLFLQDSLLKQSPKVVCIETGLVSSIEQDSHLDGQMYYSRKIFFSKEKLEYYLTGFGLKIDGQHIERYLSYFFPIIMFHENWSVITAENFDSGDYRKFVERTGFYPSSDIYECTVSDCSTFEQYELSDDSRQILDKMVTECRKKNIEIIFFTCPIEGEYHYGNAMKEYAEDNECIYINFFENLSETGISGETDFQDSGHLNSSGAAKLADYMGKYISDNYPCISKKD